ncbi:MAG: hypothetical protein QNJ00_16910 [Woeseiaceae bacterium]|nr:hypothetical protein [Woeseiaceae bacterium]
MSTICKLGVAGREEKVCEAIEAWLRERDEIFERTETEWPLADERPRFENGYDEPTLLSVKQVTADVTEIHFNSFNNCDAMASALSKALATRVVVNIFQSTAMASYWAYYRNGEFMRSIESGDDEVKERGLPLDFENDPPGHDIADDDEEPFFTFDDQDIDDYNKSIIVDVSVYQNFDAGWTNFERKPVERPIADPTKPVVYDKAKYHLDSVAEDGLPEEQAAVHTAFFLGWLMDNDLMSEEFVADSAEQIAAYKRREMTALQLYARWDYCLVDDMLSNEGNRFAAHYFDFSTGSYLTDYLSILVQDLPSQFQVEYSWDNQEVISHRIDKRYQYWKKPPPGNDTDYSALPPKKSEAQPVLPAAPPPGLEKLPGGRVRRVPRRPEMVAPKRSRFLRLIGVTGMLLTLWTLLILWSLSEQRTPASVEYLIFALIGVPFFVYWIAVRAHWQRDRLLTVGLASHLAWLPALWFAFRDPGLGFTLLVVAAALVALFVSYARRFPRTRLKTRQKLR